MSTVNEDADRPTVGQRYRRLDDLTEWVVVGAEPLVLRQVWPRYPFLGIRTRHLSLAALTRGYRPLA